MKKVISLILVFAMLLSININVMADGLNRYNVGEIVDFDEAAVSELAQEYIELGQSLRRSRVYKYLSIANYYQNGETWSNDIMQTAGLTIGSAGCALCSFAMILKHYGFSQTPRQVNNTIGNAACDFLYAQAGSYYSLSVETSTIPSSNDAGINFIIGAIANDKPVMVYLLKGNYTHYVAAYGYSGSTIAINDSERSWDYDTINEYINNGWTLRRVITYV